jgi:hypothetical protein
MNDVWCSFFLLRLHSFKSVFLAMAACWNEVLESWSKKRERDGGYSGSVPSGRENSCGLKPLQVNRELILDCFSTILKKAVEQRKSVALLAGFDEPETSLNFTSTTATKVWSCNNISLFMQMIIIMTRLTRNTCKCVQRVRAYKLQAQHVLRRRIFGSWRLQRLVMAQSTCEFSHCNLFERTMGCWLKIWVLSFKPSPSRLSIESIEAVGKLEVLHCQETQVLS